MKCPFCRKTIDDQAHVCPHCLAERTSQPANTEFTALVVGVFVMLASMFIIPLFGVTQLISIPVGFVLGFIFYTAHNTGEQECWQRGDKVLPKD